MMPPIQPKGPLKIDPKALRVAAAPEIVAAARAYVEADVTVQPDTMTYALLDTKDAFARVGVGSAEGGGYALILKKVHEIWVVVAAGQELPGQAVAQKYGLPPGWYSADY
jgi:hypothetical protein